MVGFRVQGLGIRVYGHQLRTYVNLFWTAFM